MSGNEEESQPIVLGGEDRDEFLEDTFEEAKGLLSPLKDSYPYLNWNSLEKLKISYAGIDSLAEYHEKENIVLVRTSVRKEKDEKELETALIPEMLKAVLTIPNMNQLYEELYEGINSLLAEEVCSVNQLKFESPEQIQYSVWVCQMLEHVLGQENFLYLSYNGYLMAVIDEYTVDNYGTLLFDAIGVANMSSMGHEEYDEAMLVAQDIVVHFAKNYAEATISDPARKAELLRSIESQLMLRRRYFENILL